MNHLAHFKVSHPDPALIVGGFLGDFVKGRLNGAYPERIERGIRLHRAVDAFADQHRIIKRSVTRFAPGFRRYGPIMVDVIYDHFLAKRWQTFNDDALTEFCDVVFGALEEEAQLLPADARRMAEHMAASRSLENYGRDVFVNRSLTHIGTRLKRKNPLHLAFDQFKNHEAALYEDFTVFFPELLSFCKCWQLEQD
ncbi:MAG: ACP phosphodiesterase [Pseudomonadales bacterium]